MASAGGWAAESQPADNWRSMMNKQSAIQKTLKMAYILSMLSVFLVSTLVINGIGGWIVIYGKNNFTNDHVIRGIFLSIMSFAMFYGYRRYNEHEKGLREKFNESKALIVRFMQIMGISLICLFLFLVS
ncbi:hypothetical protein [Mesorhizobium silamurunense]|uniref:hypothetical protein n=1 Tax=Mesorhizobium silamurunense TaxID=499528 RepID=UPI00177D9E29|nr:hypothetical protein [Mesorhizobium silamurunense]